MAEYTYDAWGNPIAVTDASGNAITNQNHIAHVNPLRYRGYYYDTETGLYYLQSRYYNAQWGRFLNADALFIAGDELTGSNMFAYCGNNPVMFSDPSGMALKKGDAELEFDSGRKLSIKISYDDAKKGCTSGRINS